MRSPYVFLIARTARADQVVRIPGLFGSRRLLGGIRGGKQRHDGDPQLDRFAHRLDQQVDRQAVDAGHRGHRFLLSLPVPNEHGPDQIIDGQLMFPNEGPRPGEASVAAHPRGGKTSRERLW